MSKLIYEQFSKTHEISTVFANTGCEHDETLKFVDRCDKHFKWGVVWLEAVVNPERGEGIRHKIVTFENASRKGEPFEADITKHGLPGPGYTHCTRDLKEGPIISYLRSIGWTKGSYQTAIGIRSDEMDRMSGNARQHGFIYPLIKARWTKELVNKEVASWPFDLGIPGDHFGNCVWCWKKSLRKLMTVARESESAFDFPARMESFYAKLIPTKDEYGKRFLFRNYMTSQDIIKLSKEMTFDAYSDIQQLTLFHEHKHDLDIGGACGDSCEIGSDES